MPGDAYHGALPVPLNPAVVRRLSVLSPWRSTSHIVLTWTMIVFVAVTCWSARDDLPFLGWLFLYALTVAFIGARQHDLVIVFMHDGAHHRLFRTRTLNDWFSELVLAWPFLLFSMRSYRRNHFAHHRFLNTGRDPDWVRKASWIYPRRPIDMARLLTIYLLGFGFARFLRAAVQLVRWPDDTVDRVFLVAKVAYTGGGLVVLTLSGAWLPFLLFWVLPFATWFQLVFNLRSMSDHSEIHGREGFWAMTRSTRLGLLAQLFALSGGPAFFHTEHHLYPSVPYYNLPALHRQLVQHPEYAASLHVTDGFLGFIRECMADRPDAASAR